MYGIPVWLLKIIAEAVIPIVIQWLFKHGHPAAASDLGKQKPSDIIANIKTTSGPATNGNDGAK